MASRVADETILEAVVAAVLDHGYTGATTRQIAQRAGVNEITLFRRFGDKRALLAAAVTHELEAFSSAGPAFSGDLRSDLRRVVEFYLGLFDGRGRMVLVLLTEAPRQPDLADVVHLPMGMLGEVREMVERYQGRGELVAGPSMEVLQHLVGPVVMRSVLGAVDPGLDTGPGRADRLVQRFLHGHGGQALRPEAH